jgi:uncharacterized Zn-finger protein
MKSITSAFQCLDCGKTFAIAKTLNVHIRDVHKREFEQLRTHECKTCSKAFPNRSTLKKHLRIHTGENHLPVLFVVDLLLIPQLLMPIQKPLCKRGKSFNVKIVVKHFQLKSM